MRIYTSKEFNIFFYFFFFLLAIIELGTPGFGFARYPNQQPWVCPDTSGIFTCSPENKLFYADIIDSYNSTIGTNPLSNLGSIYSYISSESGQHGSLVANGLPAKRITAEKRALESLILLDSTGIFQEPEFVNKVYELDNATNQDDVSLTDQESDDLFDLFVKTRVVQHAFQQAFENTSELPKLLQKTSTLDLILDKSTRFFVDMSADAMKATIETFTRKLSLETQISIDIQYDLLVQKIQNDVLEMLDGNVLPPKGIGFLKKVGSYGSSIISAGGAGIRMYAALSYPSMLYAKYSADNIYAKRMVLEQLRPVITNEAYDTISNNLDYIEQQTKIAAWNMFLDSRNIPDISRIIYESFEDLGDVTKGGISAAQLIFKNPQLGKVFARKLRVLFDSKFIKGVGVALHQYEMVKQDTDFKMLGFASAASSSLSGYFSNSDSKMDRFLANLLMVNSQKLFESQSWWTGSYEDLGRITGTLELAVDIGSGISSEGWIVGLLDNKATSTFWRTNQLTAINDIIDPLETIKAFQLYWNRLMYLRMELLGNVTEYDQVHLTDIIPPNVDFFEQEADTSVVQDGETLIHTFLYGLPDTACIRFFDTDTRETRIDIIEKRRTAPYYYFANLELTRGTHDKIVKIAPIYGNVQWNQAYKVNGYFVDPSTQDVSVMDPVFDPELTEKPILFFVLNRDGRKDPVHRVDLRIRSRGEILSLPFTGLNSSEITSASPKIHPISIAEIKSILGADDTDNSSYVQQIGRLLAGKQLSHLNFDFSQFTALDPAHGWAFAYMRPGFVVDVYLGDNQSAYTLRVPIYTLIKDLLISQEDLNDKQRMVVALHTTIEDLLAVVHKELWSFLVSSSTIADLPLQNNPFTGLDVDRMWDANNISVTKPVVQLTGISDWMPDYWEYEIALTREYYDAKFAELKITLPDYFLKQDGGTPLPWPAEGVSLSISMGGNGETFVQSYDHQIDNVQPGGSVILKVPVLNHEALVEGSGSIGNYWISMRILCPGVSQPIWSGAEYSIEYDKSDYPDVQLATPYLEFQTGDAAQFYFDAQAQSFTLQPGMKFCIQMHDQDDPMADWLAENQCESCTYTSYARFVGLDENGSFVADEGFIVRAELTTTGDGRYCLTAPADTEENIAYQFTSFQLDEIDSSTSSSRTITVFPDSQYIQLGWSDDLDAGGNGGNTGGDVLPDPPAECTGTKIACAVGVHTAATLDINYAQDVTVSGGYAYMADGGSGLRIIDISDPIQPVLTATVDTDYAQDVTVAGGYAYVADGGSGLRIIDISDPTQPALTATVDTTGAGSVTVSGGYAYVADGSSGLRIIDISDPTQPVLTATLDTTGAGSVTVSGGYAYVADGESGLRIIDISDPTQPVLTATVDTDYAFDVTVAGGYAYVVTGDGILLDGVSGLHIIDISDPTQPVRVATLGVSFAIDVTVVGGYAYVVDEWAGLRIIDISDPTQPVLTATVGTDYAQGVTVAGDYAYVADEGSGLRIIDISDPTQPVMAATVDTYDAFGVTVAGDYAYVADEGSGLHIIDISDPTQPVMTATVGFYSAIDVTVSGGYAYVADRSNGLRIIDISDPTQPVMTATVDTYDAFGVTVAGGYAYVADRSNGLRIIDISDPTQPVMTATVDTDDAWGVTVAGDYAYVADGISGLRIIDVSDPTQPVLTATVDTDNAWGITVAGEYAYVADRFSGLRIIDISDPTQPVLTATVDTHDAQDVAVAGGYAYVAGFHSGLRIIDISDPTHPILSAIVDTHNAQDVAVAGGYAYVAAGFSGLRITDVNKLFTWSNYYHPKTFCKFVSETIPDGSYLATAASKIWTFRSGNGVISGLKAVQVSADQGLGITATEISLGNIAADTEFTVELPINPSHDNVAIKQSVWKLMDGNNNVISITNSANNIFWLKVRTNRAPKFTDMQFASAGGRVNENVTVPIWAVDPDGDILSFSVEGTGTIANGTYSGVFTTPGVHTVTLVASDGVESARFTLNLVITDATMNQLFSDVPPAMDSYGAIHNLARRGIVIGMPGEQPGERIFLPFQQVRQADALKMVIGAAQARGLISIIQDYRLLPNLVWRTEYGQTSYRWLTPYLLTAEKLGAVDSADTFNPLLPATREWLAQLISRVFSLSAPTELFNPDAYTFPDHNLFSSETVYQHALLTAFYGYIGVLGESFDPQGSLERFQLAVIVDKILRTPTFTGLAFTPADPIDVQGKQMFSFVDDTVFQIVGVEGLEAPGYTITADNTLVDNAAPPATRVKIAVVSPDHVVSGSEVVTDLSSTPLSVTAKMKTGYPQEVRRLVVVVQDMESGVRFLKQIPVSYVIPDDDQDMVRNDEDAFPNDPTEWYDSDNDGIGDNADLDDDNDGHPDTEDLYPMDAGLWQATDIDNDGHLDAEDLFPYDPLEWADYDHDLVGDNIDTDDDNDGIPDTVELNACTSSTDFDSDDDGISDGMEDVNHNGQVDSGETNPCNADSDGDLILDGTELGIVLGDIGLDTDLAVFVPDLDPNSITSPLKADSDNDLLMDGVEDANHNGRLDAGETDPLVVNGVEYIETAITGTIKRPAGDDKMDDTISLMVFAQEENNNTHFDVESITLQAGESSADYSLSPYTVAGNKIFIGYRIVSSTGANRYKPYCFYSPGSTVSVQNKAYLLDAGGAYNSLEMTILQNKPFPWNLFLPTILNNSANTTGRTLD